MVDNQQQQVPPPPAAPAATPYDMSSAEDAADAYRNIGSIKMTFNTADPKYWFNNFERKLKTIAIQAQRTKKDALHGQLPQVVGDEVKNLLSLDETEEGPTPYKDLKNELLRLFSPKTEDAYDRAAARVMSGKPSTLARQIINDLCDCRPTLSCGCCRKVTYGMWRKNLPSHVKAHISNHQWDKDNYLRVLEVADNVWQSHKGPVHQVAAVTQSSSSSSSSTAAAPAPAAASGGDTPQVAAVSSRSRGGGGRGRGGQGSNQRGSQRGNGGQSRGRNRGGSQGQGQRGGSSNAAQPLQYHPRHRGPRHQSLPPMESCRTHWLFGGEAKWCVKTQSLTPGRILQAANEKQTNPELL